MLGTAHARCVICDRPLAAHQRMLARTCDDVQCRIAYRRHIESGRGCCAACGRPLSAQQQLRGEKTCEIPQCRTDGFSREADRADRCTLCGVPLPSHRIEFGVCDDRECTAVIAARQNSDLAEQHAERRRALLRLAERRRDEHAANSAIPDPATYRVTLLPHFSRPIKALSEQRRGEFRAYLKRLVGQAASRLRDEAASTPETSTDDADSEAAGRLMGSSCGLCGGYCCRHGGTHAQLRIETMIRFMRRYPELCPREVVDEYLDRLPEFTFEDSCVYHTETGCHLPRQMRSDACNTYYCLGLSGLRSALEEGTPARSYVVTAEEDLVEIASADFLTEHSIEDDTDSDRHFADSLSKPLD